LRTGVDSKIYGEQFTVPEKIAAIHERIAAGKPFKFVELFAAAASRNEVVATFLAMLEMIRLRQIIITQDDAFGEIMISEGEGDDGLEASAPWAEDTEPATD
jgi:segregation and condensation protein A